MRVSAGWATVTASHPLPAKSAHIAWIPSHAQLAACVLSVCCSSTCSNSIAKGLLGTTGEAHASVISPTNTTSSTSTTFSSGSSGGNSSTLHQLISLGLSKGIAEPTRWLCLSLASSLVVVRESAPPLQKAALAHVLALSLQKSLLNASQDPDAVVYLIDALGSCLLAESSSSASGLRDMSREINNLSQSIRVGSTSSAESEIDLKSIPVPELLQWVWEKFSYLPEVVTALARCIGRMAAAAAPEIGGSAPVLRRLLAIATSPAPLRIVAQAVAAKHPAVVETGSIALWAALHVSEQARANVKAIPDIPLREALHHQIGLQGGASSSGSFQENNSKRALWALLQ